MNRLLPVLFSIALLIGCGPKNSGGESASKPANTEVEEVRVFDYQPQKPVNGILKAVIEIGALGLNYFIVEADKQGRWSLVKSSFERSNIIYGVNTTSEIISTINGFREEIVRSGVNKENIHLLASSSVIKLEDVPTLNKSLEMTGFQLVSVSAEDEAIYALLATIPREFIGESFLVDIGSGNTKLAWVQNSDTLNLESHGSKYFLNDVHDTTVFREVREAVLQIPETNRNLCFMIGGTIYDLVKDKAEVGNRYYVLEAPSAYPTQNEKQKAGNILYNALYVQPTYSYIFDIESNFSIGYLLSLN